VEETASSRGPAVSHSSSCMGTPAILPISVLLEKVKQDLANPRRCSSTQWQYAPRSSVADSYYSLKSLTRASHHPPFIYQFTVLTCQALSPAYLTCHDASIRRVYMRGLICSIYLESISEDTSRPSAGTSCNHGTVDCSRACCTCGICSGWIVIVCSMCVTHVFPWLR
jgi:hypothetical protein